MPRGGLRPGAGRPKKKPDDAKPAVRAEREKLPNTNVDGTKPDGAADWPFGREHDQPAPDLSELTPLGFLLQVMRDPNEDKARRLSAAQLAAPYVHAKKGETSAKKDEAEKRKQAAQSGRFGRREPPKLATAGGKPV